MIFPGSRIWHEGSASDLSVITDEIKMSSFSGHIVLEFQESLDLVIVSQGEFLKVFEKIGRRIMTTKKYREIWGKCQIKTGRMTIFELPPNLARSLSGLCHRRLSCTGDMGSCSIGAVIREQKAAGLTGFIDGISSTGKGLLEMQGGEIVSSYFSEYYGLTYTGLEAFRKWYESMSAAEEPFSLFVSDYDSQGSNAHLWENLLTERLDNIKTPLRPAAERLFAAFGRTVAGGETLFTEGDTHEKAYYILVGTVELSRKMGNSFQALGHLQEGSVLGLSWLDGRMPPPLTGRAVSECRLLAFDRLQLEQIIYNHPLMASTLIGKAADQLRGLKARESLFRGNPRLKDLESYVFQVLNQLPDHGREGLPPGDLFRELTQMAPFTLPEMDQMVRDLVRAGRIELAGGRVRLHPEEI